MSHRLRASLLLCLCAGASSTAASAQAVVLREVALPGGAARSIAPGRDGTLWFAAGGRLGRLGAAGIGRVTVRVGDARPGALSADGHGGVWFIDENTSAIGHAGRSGPVRMFDAHAHGGGVAPDDRGNVWFTTGRRWVGRMDPRGHVTRFPLPRTDTSVPLRPSSRGPITRGRHGSMWFGASRAYGSISRTGRVVWHVLSQTEHPRAIVVRRDGVWVLTRMKVAHLRPGHASDRWLSGVPDDTGAFADLDSRDPSRGTMAAGPHGSLWLSVPRMGQFARVASDVVAPPTGPGLGEAAGPVRLGAAGLALDTRGRLWAPTTKGVAQVVFGRRCVVPDAVASSQEEAMRAVSAGGCRADVHATGDGVATDRTVTSQHPRPGAVLALGASVSLRAATPAACAFPAGAVSSLPPAPGLAVASRWQTVDAGATRIDHWICPLAHPVAERLESTGSDNQLESGEPGRLRFAVAGDRLAYYVTSAGRHYDTEVRLWLHIRHLTPGPQELLMLTAISDPPLAVNQAGIVATALLVDHPGKVVIVQDGTVRPIGTTASWVTQLSIDDSAVYWTDTQGEHSASITS